jgi:hypothetical protein
MFFCAETAIKWEGNGGKEPSGGGWWNGSPNCFDIIIFNSNFAYALRCFFQMGLLFPENKKMHREVMGNE